MPLIGWIKTCECESDTFTHRNGWGLVVNCVPLDHYAQHCPNPGFPRTLAAAVYSDTQSTRYGREDWVPSASQIDACPIETYYKNKVDYVEDVLDRRFMLRGTFAHEGILNRVGAFNSDAWLIEQKMELPLEYEDGLKFSLFGTLDCYYKPEATIFDLKTQREYAVQKKMEQTDQEVMDDPRTGKFVRQNMNQVNIYATMARQTLGIPVKKIELQYYDGAMRVRTLNVPILDEARLLDVMKHKFRILYTQVNGEEKDLDASLSPYKSVKEFPLSKSPVRYLVAKVFNR